MLCDDAILRISCILSFPSYKNLSLLITQVTLLVGYLGYTVIIFIVNEYINYLIDMNYYHLY